MAAEVVKALQIVLRQPVDLTVAGRTDRGVHALGQVVSYDGPLPRLRSVNARAAATRSSVLTAEEVPDGFSARHDAVRAQLPLPRAGPPPAVAVRARPRAVVAAPLDFDALQACAAALAGTHDFTAFTPTETYHQRFTRDVHSARLARATATSSSSDIEADSFMRNMNRILVGTMLEVAQGRRTRLRELLDGRAALGARATPPRRTASTSTAVRYA